MLDGPRATNQKWSNSNKPKHISFAVQEPHAMDISHKPWPPASGHQPSATSHGRGNKLEPRPEATTNYGNRHKQWPRATSHGHQQQATSHGPQNLSHEPRAPTTSHGRKRFITRKPAGSDQAQNPGFGYANFLATQGNRSVTRLR